MTLTKKNNLPTPSPIFDVLEHFSDPNPHHSIEKNYQEDYKHAHNFLFSYRGSEATFNSYRREVERFLHWSLIVANKSLKNIKRQDFEQYLEFCQNPPLSWIGTKQASRFIDNEGQRIPNPEWRPFVAAISKVSRTQGHLPDPKRYTLSQKGLQAIFSVLGSFYNYLLQEEYVESNPIVQIRQKSKFIRKVQGQAIIRRLSELQWAYVIETAELMAQQNPEKHERTLFIMNALYGMYLRISELTASKRWIPQMGHFQKDIDNNWWFITVGKGNKQRMITVSDDMLLALKRYRKSLNMTSLPAPGESTPLISKSSGNGPIESTRQIRSIVQDCFDRAMQRMVEDGMAEESEELKSATVHWLRHTGISDDVKIRPREHVRDDAGHSSSAITDKYIDVELRARHASARNKRIKPD